MKARLGIWTVRFLRFGLPAGFIITGFVLLFFAPPTSRYEGFSMCMGSGLSLILLNVLYHMGAKGDYDRDEEEEAREFYGSHGHWPDEEPPNTAPRQR